MGLAGHLLLFGTATLVVQVCSFHPHHVEEMTCVACNATSFCLNNNVYSCPAHSFALENADSIDDCICHDGFHRIEHTCIIGQLPFYYEEGLQKECPQPKSTTQNRSGSVQSCVCPKGMFAYPWTSECTNCPGGTFNSLANSTRCDNCAPHSTHPISGSSDALDCKCIAGYTGPDGGPCQACVAGTFKAVEGNSSCMACAANHYSDADASTDCAPCQKNSLSSPGSNSQELCQCDVGYFLNDSLCTACSIGHSKDHVGNDDCTRCSNVSYSDAEASAQCIQCNENSASSADRASCLCSQGYEPVSVNNTQPNVQCRPCAEGFYKNITSNDACQSCNENKIVSVLTSAEGSSSSDACFCIAGYSQHGVLSCSACEAGKYQPTTSTAHETSCLSCPRNSTSASGSTRFEDCECLPGFEDKNGTTCVACLPGTFKNTTGNHLCALCPTDTFQSDHGQTSCVRCFKFSAAMQGSASRDDCQCIEGYSRVQSYDTVSCSACAPGKYSTTSGCAQCSSTSFTDQWGQSRCTDCMQHSIANDNNTACQCNPGFHCPGAGCNLGNCTICPLNFFQSQFGQSECTPCQASSQTLQAGSTESTHCKCNAGYIHEATQSTSECVACLPGHYSDQYLTNTTVGAQKCSKCPLYTITTSLHPSSAYEDCISCQLCTPGFYWSAGCNNSAVNISDAVCTRCPLEHTTTPVPSTDTINTLNRGVSACVCEPGFGFNTSSGTCQECSLNTFKPALGNEDCHTCPAFSSTLQVQSVHITQCLCNAGYSRNYTTGECVECSENSFKNIIGDNSCVACADGSTTGGLSGQLECVCMPGYQMRADNCVRCDPGSSKSGPGNYDCSPCAADTYAFDAGQETCQPCPNFTVSNPNATALSTCPCALGYQHATDQVTCVTCANDTFRQNASEKICLPCTDLCAVDTRVIKLCTTTNDLKCERCQANSSLPEPSLRHFCDCHQGFAFENNSCVPCPLGHSKSTNANNSVPCEPCAPEFYADAIASATCKPCDTRCASTTKFVLHECTSSSNIVCAQCQSCQPGFYEKSACGESLGRNDTVCQICPANRYCPDGISSSPCPAFSSSSDGSISVNNCSCDPGYHAQGSSCVPCDFGFYCVDEVSVKCPAHAYTTQRASQHILDCICKKGYKPQYVSDFSSMTCVQCNDTEFCFNNSATQCPDDRMRAPGNSSHVENCTCIDGFFQLVANECTACPPDTYCEDGHRFLCNKADNVDDLVVVKNLPGNASRMKMLNRWTENASAQTDVLQCHCKPGYWQGVQDINSFTVLTCLECDTDHYCPGDNTRYACPIHQESPTFSTKLSDCICKAGYGVKYDGNTKSCVRCNATSFKQSGDHVCSACKKCGEYEYEHRICGNLTENKVDTQCSACSHCNAEAEETQEHECLDQSDTTCRNCTQCVFAYEFQLSPCRDTMDRVCHNITKTLCGAGEFRGNHSRIQNSHCLPCRVHAPDYQGTKLHTFTGPALRYDDAYSCPLTCSVSARLVNASQPALGCTTCEQGNILRKRFRSNQTHCLFECVEHYRIQGDDCVNKYISPQQDMQLDVTNFLNTSIVNGNEFEITHSILPKFVIAVGPEPVADCSHRQHFDDDNCCFRNHWRISSLAQMGRVHEHCSQTPSLDYLQKSTQSILVRIPYERMPTVANCSSVSDTRSCRLFITLVDLLHARVLTRSIVINVQRSSMITFANHQLQYVPLREFKVDVFFLNATTNTYRLLVNLQSRHNATMSLRVQGALYQAKSSALCNRLPVAPDAMRSLTISVREQQKVTWVTEWKFAFEPRDFRSFVLVSFDNTHADISYVRNITNLQALCVAPSISAHIPDATVKAGAGLGESVIHSLSTVNANVASFTTYQTLGSLSTFLVLTRSNLPTTTTLDSVLVAYGTHQADEQRMKTASLDGKDFSPDFRYYCLQTRECEYEYLLLNSRYDATYQMNSCDDMNRTTAWIRKHFGVPSDSFHANALCDVMRKHKFSSTAFVLHTGMHVNRNIFTSQSVSYNNFKTYLWISFRFFI